MSVVLAAEHLTKTFVSLGRENYTAVDDVSFSVESGEKLGIIGESGSGKTTVVNMITRLLFSHNAWCNSSLSLLFFYIILFSDISFKR